MTSHQTPNSDYACVLKNVHKTISGVKILDGVNLQLRRGKVTALLGPNGAGKTSTIRVILGLLEPQIGVVEVLGIPVSDDKKQIRKKVGLLPQTDAGYKSLSGRENLEFLINLAGRDMTEVEEELHALLSRLDLNEIIDQDFGTLSGGERRAIGFVRAILSGSQFLILDEPTTGLDLARAAILRKIIQEQVRQGKTILMSSHVLTDLEELADDIIIMKNGAVIKSGTRAEIQEYFAPGEELENAIVNAFMGKNMHLEEL